MLDIEGRGPATIAPLQISAVEFLRIELAPLADGGVFVLLTATTVDQEEPQLLDQEIARDRVATIDDVLALIQAHVRIAAPQPLRKEH